MFTQAILDEIDSIEWWHTIDLGDGIVTKRRDGANTKNKLKRIELPDDLTGKTILDIGAWSGFYAFECEKRGAQKVVAMDSDKCAWSEAKGGRKGFDLAHRLLKSNVEPLVMDVYDLSPDVIGQFDLVLFLGVLYHLRYPLYALEKVASVTKTDIIIETHVNLLDVGVPAIAFYPDAFHGDTTNWCGPNELAMVVMMRDVGFQTVKHISTNTGNRAVFHGSK